MAGLSPRSGHTVTLLRGWAQEQCAIVVRAKQPERPMPAKRAYGMDQDFHPWSPIATRPVLRWPDNARVASAVIVNLEHWDWEVPAGTPMAVSPMGGPEGIWTGNQPQFPDIGLRQPRIRQPGRDFSHPRGARQIPHQADLGAR